MEIIQRPALISACADWQRPAAMVAVSSMHGAEDKRGSKQMRQPTSLCQITFPLAALLEDGTSPLLLFFICSVIWQTHCEARSGVAESVPSRRAELVLLSDLARWCYLCSCCTAFVKIREKDNAFNIKTPSICPRFLICIFLINLYMLHVKHCYIG
uniref:Uncharacterized protein n=1 Tax=Rhipicephalus zambeziensis TaxID=60191 RepID=A0A224YB80_9ACAR